MKKRGYGILLAGCWLLGASLTCSAQFSKMGDTAQLTLPGLPWALSLEAPGFRARSSTGVDPFARTAQFSMQKVQKGKADLSVKAEQSKARDEMALATLLSTKAAKRGLDASLPEGDLPRKIQGEPCAWLFGASPSGVSIWLAFGKGEAVFTFTCEGPKDREKETRACLAGVAKSFRWNTP